MATIKDVARMAGVSIATVSKYINGGNVREENLDAISRAIEALDYRVNPFARNLKTQRSRSIGILIPDIATPFFGTVLTALDKVLREHGYHSLISCYSANHGLERDNLQFLISNGIDGLVYVPEDLTAEEFYELTVNCSIPTVQIDRMIPGVNSDAVLVNNSDAAYQAVSSLLDKGHTRVAMITGPKSVLTAKERQVGYLKAISDRGLLYDDVLFISEQNDFATGYRGCERLMALSDPPTAIFTTNYNVTMGCITAARERGLRIPEDVDVFGYDCVEICAMMKPPLPVVHQPEEEIGRMAATFLLERLSGCSEKPRIVRLPCRLVQE
jgi:DNA-binding LacI/PurR family transcriptional regulator